MNKKYKPKKPIVYDIDRSLLHSASETVLTAIGSDIIIGQPQCNTKQVQIGTKKVQVGTNTIKDMFGIVDQGVQNYSHPGEVMYWKVFLIANKPNTKAITRWKVKNRTETSTTVNCPVGKVTQIKVTMPGNTSNYEYYITNVYIDDKIVYTLNGPNSRSGKHNYTQVSYSEPVYEDQPVYKTEVDRGLIMYLRRKGA